MADGVRAKDVAAGSSIIIWRMNGSEARNPDDMEDRRCSVSLDKLGQVNAKYQ